jgi:hypothetical protein
MRKAAAGHPLPGACRQHVPAPTDQQGPWGHAAPAATATAAAADHTASLAGGQTAAGTR